MSVAAPDPPARRSRRLGLVLGAGGPVGHAYHVGVLRALYDVLGWDPRQASLVVGTSAGAQVAALLLAGMSAVDLAARVLGRPLSAAGAAIARHYRRADRRAPRSGNPRRLWPAAPEYLLRTLRRPWSIRPAHLVSALLPPGRACLRGEAEAWNRLFPTGWPRQALWITAVQLDTGRLVVFGKRDAPCVDVGTAVTCSGAVPGLCAPVEIEGHRYVDGGLASGSGLLAVEDLDRDLDLDLIIASNPLSHMPAMRGLFQREVSRLRQRGIPVVGFEPSRALRAVMGYNPMDVRRGPCVAAAAHQATLRELETAERRDVLSAVF